MSYYAHSDDVDPLSTNVDEVTRVVRSLKNRKAPGFDSIRSLVFKNLSAQGLAFYTAILNAIFRLHYFPDAWKTAKIIPICKPGKPPNLPGSQRPISLLPIPSKVCEKIVASRLKDVMREKEVIPHRQFGFRDRHSTCHALLSFTKDVKENLNSRKSVVAASLDIEKAFDTVWLKGLIYKLIKLGFPSPLIKLLHSYLFGRRFRVSIDGVVSREMQVTQGVPEGSVLGPLLFTIFVSDIPTLPFTQLEMFADDTTLRSSSMYPSVAYARIQRHLDLLSSYFDKWKIRVNPAKTEHILFTRKRKIPRDLRLNYCGDDIRRVEKLKLLGLVIDEKLSYSSHIQRAVMRTNDVTRRLNPLLKRNSGLSVDNKLTLYKIFIRSILTYAIQIWHTASRINMLKVQIVQNKVLRNILNLRPHPVTHRQVSNVVIHERTGVEHIDQFVSRLTLKFFNGMTGHENPHVGSFTNVNILSMDESHPFYVIRDDL